MPGVAVCVVTYKRPVWLRALLESFARLEPHFETDTAPLFIVVDNDANGSARSTTTQARVDLHLSIDYQLEPRRGISYARNRAVTLALASGAEFIAFVDDDEMVSPSWLRELLAVQRGFAADVVSGPVLPRFEAGVPDWIVRGGFFERPRYPTGAIRQNGATNNCLISSRLFSGFVEPFDTRFATSGGSDMHFFKQAARSGAKIVWADEAVVEEWVPRSRARVRWLLQRAYRGGNAFTLSERILDSSGMWFMWRVVKGLGRTVQGTLLVLPSIFLGRAPAVRALQRTALGVGTLAAIIGLQYEEYRAVHGR